MRRLLLLGVLALAVPARAQTVAASGPLPPTPTDYVYARSLALSAYRGLAGDNDAIFYNPACLAARRRLEIDLQGLFGRDGSAPDGTYFSASAVDSTSGPVAGGFSYTLVNTLGYSGHGFFSGSADVALAMALGKTFYIGATLTYLNVASASTNVNAVNLNGGAFWQVAKVVSLGAVGYNFFNTYHPDLTPLALGAGVAVGPDQVFHVTGDFYREWGTIVRNVWSLGAEVFPFNFAAVRGGWIDDPGRNTEWWSAGLGIMVGAFGADLAYRQAFGATYRIFAAGIKLVPNL